MPEYPRTGSPGVLHFIHCENPFGTSQPESMPPSDVCAVFTKQMSKVSSAYA